MGTPTQTETFCFVTEKFHLRVHLPSGHKLVFCPVPNHDSVVCTHRRYQIRILRLISGFVDLAFVIYLLYDIELDLHDWRLLRRSASISADLFALFVVVYRVRGNWFGKLDFGYL